VAQLAVRQTTSPIIRSRTAAADYLAGTGPEEGLVDRAQLGLVLMIIGGLLVLVGIVGMPGDKVTLRSFVLDIPFFAGIALLLVGRAWRRTT
jgi:hypothetical protein